MFSIELLYKQFLLKNKAHYFTAQRCLNISMIIISIVATNDGIKCRYNIIYDFMIIRSHARPARKKTKNACGGNSNLELFSFFVAARL